MALLKSITASGKKPSPMPGPKSAAYKKIAAANRKNGSKKGKKQVRGGSAFSTLKSRQMLVERVKRAIWSSVAEINEAIITLAKAGNYSAAKALFDFAGVYSLPLGDDENAKAAPAPVAAASAAPAVEEAPDPVDAFFRSIGMQSTDDELESEMADAG